ncbi:MAG: hypothetical protein M1514_02420 [Patescibacteria group bacterium]|nr:hypothetical protein [Patescibacteria group bacterium]
MVTELSSLDPDTKKYREQSLSVVYSVLQEKFTELRRIEKKNKEQIILFLKSSSDDINRAVVGASEQVDIYSSPDVAIVQAGNEILWKKPKNIVKLEEEILDALVTKWQTGDIDQTRLSQGVYFLETLLHKYKNGNGRVARSMKTIIDLRDKTTELTEDETRTVLAIERKVLIHRGGNLFEFSINPDFERLVLGVAYFGIHKGLSLEQVTEELKLNGKVPEKGLEALSSKIGIPTDQLKDEFVKFMVVDSNLDWCNF